VVKSAWVNTEMGGDATGVSQQRGGVTFEVGVAMIQIKESLEIGNEGQLRTNGMEPILAKKRRRAREAGRR